MNDLSLFRLQEKIKSLLNSLENFLEFHRRREAGLLQEIVDRKADDPVANCDRVPAQSRLAAPFRILAKGKADHHFGERIRKGARDGDAEQRFVASGEVSNQDDKTILGIFPVGIENVGRANDCATLKAHRLLRPKARLYGLNLADLGGDTQSLGIEGRTSGNGARGLLFAVQSLLAIGLQRFGNRQLPKEFFNRCDGDGVVAERRKQLFRDISLSSLIHLMIICSMLCRKRIPDRIRAD